MAGQFIPLFIKAEKFLALLMQKWMLFTNGSTLSYVEKQNRAYKEIQRLAKKFDIYVARISRKDGEFLESKPCKFCAIQLKKYGFKNVCYSTSDGGFTKVRVKDLESTHVSHASTFVEKHIPHFKGI